MSKPKNLIFSRWRLRLTKILQISKQTVMFGRGLEIAAAKFGRRRGGFSSLAALDGPVIRVAPAPTKGSLRGRNNSKSESKRGEMERAG